ncbi:hypothetical protein ACFQ0T_09170 [Kitasatospora gansuensis]
MPSLPRRSAAFLIVLPLLLAGCAGTAAPSSGSDRRGGPEAPPPVSAIPTLESANDQPLPLDAYLLNPDQVSTSTRAQQELMSRCMQGFGLIYAPPASSEPHRDSDAPTTRVDGRYGSQSAVLMAKWGYHSEGGLPAPAAGSAAGGLPTSPEMVVVERGTSDPKQRFGPGGQVVNGRTVPEHGCIGEVRKQLTGAVDGWMGDAQIAIDIKFTTLRKSQEDERTRSVFAKWSQCMKDSGHDYPDPLAAIGDPEWRNAPLPSQRELQVATADAACRTKHNVVGVWYAVDFAYQEQAIKDNAAAMAKAKASVEAQVAAAKRVLIA